MHRRALAGWALVLAGLLMLVLFLATDPSPQQRQADRPSRLADAPAPREPQGSTPHSAVQHVQSAALRVLVLQTDQRPASGAEVRVAPRDAWLQARGRAVRLAKAERAAWDLVESSDARVADQDGRCLIPLTKRDRDTYVVQAFAADATAASELKTVRGDGNVTLIVRRLDALTVIVRAARGGPVADAEIELTGFRRDGQFIRLQCETNQDGYGTLPATGPLGEINLSVYHPMHEAKVIVKKDPSPHEPIRVVLGQGQTVRVTTRSSTGADVPCTVWWMIFRFRDGKPLPLFQKRRESKFGFFEIGGIPEDAGLRVLAASDRFGLATTDVFPAKDVTLALQPFAVLEGRVVSEINDAPLVGVSVHLSLPLGEDRLPRLHADVVRNYLRATTDGAGRFRLERVPAIESASPTIYKILIAPPTPKARVVVESPKLLEVLSGDRVEIEVRVRDIRPVVVHGVVRAKTGAALPDAKVRGGREVALTNQDGRYRVETTTSGPLRLVCDADGYKRYVSEELEVEPGAELSHDIELERVYTVRGQVLQAGGAGLSRVSVGLVDDAHRQGARTFSDDKGMFSFRNVTPGTYRLVATLGRWATSSQSFLTRDVTVPTDEVVVLSTRDVPQVARVRGTIRPPAGRPIPGEWSLELLGLEGLSTVRIPVAISETEFTAEAVPWGSYLVRCTVRSGAGTRTWHLGPYAVSESEQQWALDLPAEGSVSGTIRDDRGAPLAEMGVVFLLARNGEWLRDPIPTTDAAGRFEAQLPPGTYHVHGSNGRYAAFQRDVTIRPGTNTSLELEASLAGVLIAQTKVNRADGAWIDGFVTVTGPVTVSIRAQLRVRSGIVRATFHGLLPGPYEIELVLAGEGVRKGSATIVGGKRVNLSIEP